MILLRTAQREGRPDAAAVFGAGLIGQNVVAAFNQRCAATSVDMHVDWVDEAARRVQCHQVETALAEHARDGCRIAFLWSAGRVGFSSTDVQVHEELRAFEDVLAIAEHLAARGADVSFHHVSSAGGLFEGQRCVTEESRVAPQRPYGRLKLRQEELLRSSDASLARHIYRVTTVYGYVRPHFRSGIVATLIRDGINRAVTLMTGRNDTLRDLVFVDDVAAFIADRMLDRAASASSVSFLARARPSSLWEVQHTVEHVMGRKLHVAYSLDQSNARDITFAPAILPPRWAPSDLQVNVVRIYRDALSKTAVLSPAPSGGGRR